MKMTIYNKGITLFAMLILLATTASSQQLLLTQRTTAKDATACGLPVSEIKIKRNAELMALAMNMKLADYNMHGDRASIFYPVLKNGEDSLVFDPVGLYGRTRYIQYLRYNEQPIGGDNEMSYKYVLRPEEIAYVQTVPYSEWMNGATLYMRRNDYGCCSTLLDEKYEPLAAWREVGYTPVYHFVAPVIGTENGVKEKVRELSGRAYIDFPVNMTDLYPNYRNNPTELAKIIATIDSVRNDKDITVRRITIKGWASPESPWENNARLAKGRTATLKQYVQNLYNFPHDFIETDYYPEDWFGLRDFVEMSNLEHKNEILAIIDDSSLDPDPKEDKLKKTYPDEYRFLLATIYPALRHSDYTIEYIVRQFTDPSEIRKVMQTEPQKLSLEEFYLLASTLKSGSEEYKEVFEIAVRMYPNDELANLNAANSAMQHSDLVKAEKYLSKVGENDEATYARGIYAALTEDYNKAMELFRKVENNIPDAKAALQVIRELTN